MSDDPSTEVRRALAARFVEDFHVDTRLTGLDTPARIANHRTQRRYTARPIEASLLRLLCACALSAPSKSDLQQCDILIVEDAATRKTMGDLIPDMPWIVAAPAFLVFLANGRRLKRISELRDKPFPNDHL